MFLQFAVNVFGLIRPTSVVVVVFIWSAQHVYMDLNFGSKKNRFWIKIFWCLKTASIRFTWVAVFKHRKTFIQNRFFVFEPKFKSIQAPWTRHIKTTTETFIGRIIPNPLTANCRNIFWFILRVQSGARPSIWSCTYMAHAKILKRLLFLLLIDFQLGTVHKLRNGGEGRGGVSDLDKKTLRYFFERYEKGT